MALRCVIRHLRTHLIADDTVPRKSCEKAHMTSILYEKKSCTESSPLASPVKTHSKCRRMANDASVCFFSAAASASGAGCTPAPRRRGWPGLVLLRACASARRTPAPQPLDPPCTQPDLPQVLIVVSKMKPKPKRPLCASPPAAALPNPKHSPPPCFHESGACTRTRRRPPRGVRQRRLRLRRQ